MTTGQQKLAHALLNSGLSQRGYAKAVTIMSLDDILKEIGERQRASAIRSFIISPFSASPARRRRGAGAWRDIISR